MRLAPLRQHSAYIHPHGVIHIAGQHVFKTRCVCQGQRYPRRLLQPLISRVLIASLILPTAHADIIADPGAPGQQQPIILETANGLPLVNIQTPSAAGVSHNTYQQFDVARPGAILNNSTQSVSTQLGGWVQANPHLATGSARLILNEVNSSHPSQLHGFVEIAGSQAELVIANPAGIQCNGCGFINTPHATLTTGTPVMQGGNLAAYRVGGGNISISGLGMDASQVNYAQVIARAVELNASLWAQHLKIITGLNQVSRAGEIQQSQLPPSTSAAADTRLPAPPRFALDVAALGGMYAGKIFLIGTEAGMGVSNAGHLGASAGDIYLSSDGTLHNTGRMQSQGNIQVNTAGDITNSGQMLSQGDSQLSTSADIHNSGSIAAQGNLNLHATGDHSNITNSQQAILAAGIQADGSVSTQGKLSLSASRINAQGQQLSGAEQHYLAQHLNLSQSQISSRQLSLAASLGDIDLSDSELYISDTLSASTEHSLNTQRATLQAGQFSFKAAQLNNQAGSLIQTGNSSLIFQLINGLDNQQGRISTQGSLKIQTSNVHNQQGRISANQALEIQATDAVDNSEGQLLANQSLKINASEINNQQGTIGSVLGQVSLNSRTGAFNNMAGYVQAADNLSLAAQGINNQHGNLQGRSVAVHNQGFSLNNTQGSIRSLGTDDSEQLMLETGDLINAAGLIHSEQNLYT